MSQKLHQKRVSWRWC